ncbi:hypothetical protein AB4Y43_18270 [Paraburkholderia sp. BR10872]|uniref:hypothetical protein n=1 Tax=Paraburkholderia sp. BR10872 TaxID=3236989 RepID=UPI0034D30C23
MTWLTVLTGLYGWSILSIHTTSQPRQSLFGQRMNDDHLEPAQRHNNAIMCCAENALDADVAAFVRAVKARGGDLVQSQSGRGEYWVSLVDENARPLAILFYVSRNGSVTRVYPCEAMTAQREGDNAATA